MPSSTHPLLVASLAEALSSVGRIPLLGSLSSTRQEPGPGAGAGADGPGEVTYQVPRAPGERGGNSVYRLADVWRAFEVGPSLATTLAEQHGPVLLVDDLIDSRWSMTVAGRVLRAAGADSVLPFALAIVG
jgi:ATP-dependent DNA helicase RecQ